MRVKISNCVLELLEGDITEMQTEAIVNAANARLILGGGVAGAIRRKGGPKIQEECSKIGGTFVGGAVKTTGGNLKAKYVIHAVGPQMGEGNEDEKLKNATVNSLKLADENNIKSISFPAISAGIFGFPIERCAKIMLRTTIDYLQGQTGLEKVIFCLFGRDSYEVFANQLKLASGRSPRGEATGSHGQEISK
jgi:O-acetyl-ADP-ribose deacetylase (regulator of RNase III)